jgi:butyrate kinase
VDPVLIPSRAEHALVVAHLGTGISLAALRRGRMVDVVNPLDEGPMGPDRSGGLPVTAVVDLCFAPGAERSAVRRRLLGEGGLFSHPGTRDVAEALRRAGSRPGSTAEIPIAPPRRGAP